MLMGADADWGKRVNCRVGNVRREPSAVIHPQLLSPCLEVKVGGGGVQHPGGGGNGGVGGRGGVRSGSRGVRVG